MVVKIVWHCDVKPTPLREAVGAGRICVIVTYSDPLAWSSEYPNLKACAPLTYEAVKFSFMLVKGFCDVERVLRAPNR